MIRTKFYTKKPETYTILKELREGETALYFSKNVFSGYFLWIHRAREERKEEEEEKTKKPRAAKLPLFG